MKKLQKKSLMQFLVCIIVVLLLSMPLFYLLTKYFYAEDMVELIENVNKDTPVPPSDIEKDIMGGMMIQLVLFCAVLSISLLITLRFATKRLWKPFYNTLSKMQHFNLNQKTLPEFENTDIQEFYQLNDAALQLIQRNLRSYSAQKEFTENASHELQTPLAITKCKVDLLLNESLTENQYHLVSDIEDVNNRMSHLNTSLLMLAKIDNHQYADIEDIIIADSIQKAKHNFQDLYPNHIIVSTIQPNSTKFVQANAILFDSLINNLLINSIRHSRFASPIEIIMNENTLSITNAATNGPLDEQTLFHRFNKQVGDKNGTGLGLSIVKAICNYYDWDIQYQYMSNRHVFSVTFKSTKY